MIRIKPLKRSAHKFHGIYAAYGATDQPESTNSRLGATKKIAAILILLFSQFHLSVYAQDKTNIHKAQVWLGYMTSLRISRKLSLWNDAHYVTQNFLIGRHGLSYHVNNQTIVTGGYAWLFLSTSFSDKLIRNEHRPWGQVLFVSPIGTSAQLQQRIRYDARFRQSIENNAIGDGYTFNHRLRYMFSIRRSLSGNLLGNKKPFISTNSEILINFGKNIRQNNLDQFRATLLGGYTLDNVTVQLGYMYRYVPQSAAYTYGHFHGITLWVNHQFKSKWQQENLIRSK